MYLNKFQVSIFFFSFFFFQIYPHLQCSHLCFWDTCSDFLPKTLQSFFWTLLITPDVSWSHLADKLERMTEKWSSQRKPGLNSYGLQSNWWNADPIQVSNNLSVRNVEKK